MRRMVLLSAVLLLAACAPIAAPRHDATTSSRAASSAPADGDMDGAEADVTIEPFEDPLAPISLTGAAVIPEERVLSGGILEIGSADAQVTVTVFLHPESPYSQEFQRSRMPVLLNEFVARGVIKIHAFILPITKYAGSAFAGRAVSCAMEQGKGYPTLDLLVEGGKVELTDEDIADLSLDRDAYDACLKTGTDNPLTASENAATTARVTLVPSYVIDPSAGSGHDPETFVGLPGEADLVGAVRAAVR